MTGGHARDLWCLHQDEVVAFWYGGSWSHEQAQAFATHSEQRWQADGVGKWMAYDRRTDELVGRGGLSRVPIADAFFRPVMAVIQDADGAEERLEVGWAIRNTCQGQGYATEPGREGLDFAVDEFGATKVVSFTEIHNRASWGVMARLGMKRVGQFLPNGLIEAETASTTGLPSCSTPQSRTFHSNSRPSDRFALQRVSATRRRLTFLVVVVGE